MKYEAGKERVLLEELYSKLPSNKQKIARTLIDQAIFMAEELDKLQEHISEHGWSEEYQNGANQKGKKSSIEATAFIKLQKNYSSTIRQLTDLIPKEEIEKDELLEFLRVKDALLN